MEPRRLPWALMLLGPALALALGRAPVPEVPEKLCGHHFVRALVRVCGGPRWSLEAGRPVAGSDREWEGCGLLLRVSKWGRCTGTDGRRGRRRVCKRRPESTCQLRPVCKSSKDACSALRQGVRAGTGARPAAPGSLENSQIPSLFTISVFLSSCSFALILIFKNIVLNYD